MIDCQDPDCNYHPACSGGGQEICDNGIDDDGDNKIDCDDILDCGGFCIQQLKQENQQLQQRIDRLEYDFRNLQREIAVVEGNVRKLLCQVFGGCSEGNDNSRAERS